MTHVATLEGKMPPKMATLPDGAIVVAQPDAPPATIPPESPAARAARLVGCGCGEVTMLPEFADDAREGRCPWPESGGKVHRYGLTCRPAPERAGREGDQALPVDGVGPTIHEVLALRMLERGMLGQKRYGKPLQAFNGRDSFRDLEEELLDGLAYLEQARTELDAIVQALLVLRRMVEKHGSVRVLATEEQESALALAEKLEASRGL
jgi:hypothetical protein